MSMILQAFDMATLIVAALAIPLMFLYIVIGIAIALIDAFR